MSFISVISPAKSLNFEQDSPLFIDTPRFEKETLELVSKLKKFKPKGLSDLMSISTPLAELNTKRYQIFDLNYTKDNSKAAIYAFTGDVYVGLDVKELQSDQIDYLQSKLRILSGLYGLLRPMDGIQAYRLEMGTRISVKKAKNLYEFWGDKITQLLNQDLKDNHCDTILNLASIEYFKSINKKKLNAQIVNIHFKEYRNGVLKVISFNAKKARGMMVKYLAQNNITNTDQVKAFDIDNYLFNDELSSNTDYYFTR